MKPNNAALDEMFDHAAANEVFPGVVAIVANSTGVVYQGAFGMRDCSSGDSMEVESLHGIASMTKLATAIALLQLVERGDLDLQAPVGDLLPAYDALPVLEGFSPGGKPVLRPPRRRGTVFNLLTHTSGLAHPMWNAKLGHYVEATEGLELADLSGNRKAFTVPLVCDPGEKFIYGMGMDWVGLIIEAVAGRPYEVVLQEQVLEPLGLRDTVPLRSGGQLARTAKVHTRSVDGHWVPMLASYYATGVTEPEYYPAGHCLYSTAPDFMRLQMTIMNGGTYDGVQLLAPGTVEGFFRNQIGNLDVGLMRTAIPSASCDVPLQGWKWGLGIMMTDQDRPEGRSAGAAGWCGGWNTFYWIDRAKGLAAALYTQSLPFYDPGVIDCYKRFESLVYGCFA
jgi:CubicO group peptidase (beta-lactamase class C family)